MSIGSEAVLQAILDADVTKAELAHRMKASRSTVHRLTSPDYDGHSMLSMRKVAEALGMEVEVKFIPKKK